MVDPIYVPGPTKNVRKCSILDPMYFTTLPDHSAPGFDEKAHFSRFSQQNVIFNAFSRESNCDNHVGCLSLKTVLSGEEWYKVDGRHVAIQPGQFLILNDNQDYSCQIKKGSGAQVLSLFFQKEFAASDRQLLRQVNAVKPSTKREIYKRLCVVKDILHSFFHEPLDLSELSTRACLSMPQLIRQFKSVFGRTPYQYLVDIRLRHAAELLKQSSVPVREIVWHCGFNDASAFGRAFKSAYGIPPEQFRQTPSPQLPRLIQ
jgi:AraC-like DNA-binding protein